MNRSIQEVIAQYNEAFRLHDAALLRDLLTEDCVIEDSTPAPDGARHVGRAACFARWAALAEDTALEFRPEGVETFQDRAIVRWLLTWGHGSGDHLRGLNIIRVCNGQICEAWGYVKS